MKVFLALLVACVAMPSAGFEACKEQSRFDIMMCKSHMCTDCTLAWCMEGCQSYQEEMPTCRCEDWPDARKSYSGGEYEGKGKFGDVGDYSKENFNS
mmetsp:Transcript_13020/g.24321  ORF Transcript_13020/g.24321 Transcript_13020/m.24321 type:complete len:97 (-) Transcript_13020:40-330(-)